METTTLHPVVMKLNFPFITRKPSFCGRTLIEGHNTELLHRYVLAMALELKANAADLADCEVQAIRLGGGSASIINGSDLDHLLRLIRSCYHVAENAPVTMRTCPADINGANMPFYNRSHVTRYDLDQQDLPDVVAQRIRDLDRRIGALENAAQGDTPPTASQIAARQKP